MSSSSAHEREFETRLGRNTEKECAKYAATVMENKDAFAELRRSILDKKEEVHAIRHQCALLRVQFMRAQSGRHGPLCELERELFAAEQLAAVSSSSSSSSSKDNETAALRTQLEKLRADAMQLIVRNTFDYGMSGELLTHIRNVVTSVCFWKELLDGEQSRVAHMV